MAKPNLLPPEAYRNNPAWPGKLLTVKEQCERCGVSKAALYRAVAADESFPQPYKNPVTGRPCRSQVELDDWLRQKLTVLPVDTERGQRVRAGA